MKNIIRYIILFIVCFSCNNYIKQSTEKTTVNNSTIISISEEDFVNTKWIHKIAEDCISYYEFKEDNKNIYYVCVKEDTIYGTYKVENDTLFIIGEHASNDKYFPINSVYSVHRYVPTMIKHVLKQNKLVPCSAYELNVRNKTWEKLNYVEYDSTFYYVKTI
jgi:hypothetical protein